MHLIASRLNDRSTLWNIALLALTVVFGLQLLRVLLTGLVFYIRDSLGAGSFVPGVYALALFSLAFLATPLCRRLGTRRTLMLAGGGVALARLVEQLVTSPVADLGLSTVGTALFLIFIPTYIGHVRGRGVQGSQVFVAGLLLGIAADTAIKGVYGTLDLSWQPGPVTYLIVVLLVVCHLLILRRVASESGPDLSGDGRFLRMAPLIALGPVLFLELLLFQNIGQQTALTGWDQSLVFLWVVIANAVGIAAAMGVLVRPAHGGWVTLVALGGLLALLVLWERSGLAAALVVLFGQAAISMAVGMVGVALWSEVSRRSVGATSVASGVGMLLLLVLTFLYYVNYEVDIPGGTTAVPPIAAAIVLLSVAAALPSLRYYRTLAVSWVPVVFAFTLLLLPLGYLASWDEPEPVAPAGFPVRVMSYNLHQGFDVNGHLSIEELARVIEEQEPDVIALQEVSRGWVIDGSFDMLVWLSRRLDMPYAWGPAADSVWGNAVLSRYPIASARTVPMPNNAQMQLKRSLTTARIDLGNGESLKVIATHLHHPAGEGHLRVPQVEAILREWDEEGRSVVLGDFNALPGDPEMRLLSDAGLVDAFPASSPYRVEATSQPLGYTSTSRNPTKRIDYIWVSQDLKLRDFALTDSIASDHLGVAVTLHK